MSFLARKIVNFLFHKFSFELTCIYFFLANKELELELEFLLYQIYEGSTFYVKRYSLTGTFVISVLFKFN